MSDDDAPSWPPLIARLRADDQSALRELMQAEYRRVVAIAQHYVRTPDLARDVAQDVFISLWERRHSLRDDTRLGPYLRRAAHNLALKLLARDASAARLERSLLREYDVLHPHDDNLGVTATEAAEFNAQVRAVLATLTPRVREIMLLYHEHGLEPTEIAEFLGIAPPTVYVTLRKAMHALQRAFRAAASDPNERR